MQEAEEYIVKFFHEIKEKYPDIPFEEINRICRTPFLFLKEQMAMPHLPEIRFKYWGSFRVKKGRINTLPDRVKVYEERGNTPQEEINRMKKILIVNNLNSK
jgi:hypothetical protein